MWWECEDCVAGGNGEKSLNEHSHQYPSHKTTVIQDTIIEEA